MEESFAIKLQIISTITHSLFRNITKFRMPKSTLRIVLFYVTMLVAMSVGSNDAIILLSLKIVFADSGMTLLNK